MATIQNISGGKKVNGVDLTTAQFEAWQNAGEPSQVEKWVAAGMPQDASEFNPQKTSGSIPTPSSSSSTSGGSEATSVQKAKIGTIKYDLRSDGFWYIDGTNTFATNQEDLTTLIDAFGGAAGTSTTPTTGTGGTSTSTPDTSGGQGPVDFSDLENNPEFKKLAPDDQEAVRAVFKAVASNDQKLASRLAESFEAAAKINDPFFAQQLRIAVDAIERGYVSIDKQAEFEEQQLQNRISDLQQDITSRKSFLSLEEASILGGIERQYKVQLDNTRNSLAATGFTQSTRRAEQEGLLAEERGSLVESTQRQFGAQQLEADRDLARSTRDTQAEIQRLSEVAKEQKTSLLRQAEESVGTANLPNLGSGIDPLGDIYGQIPQNKLQDTINAATSFVF